MTIELYVFPPSPHAFKVMAVASHLDIDYALHMVDLRKGEQKAPHYAALNPNMRMPTLKDGDYVLWESNAIAQYLALKRPESGLLPKDERARLEVTRWQFWELAHWDPALDCAQPFEAQAAKLAAQPHLVPAPHESAEPYRFYSTEDGHASYLITEPGAPGHPAILMQTASGGQVKTTGCPYGSPAGYKQLVAYLDSLKTWTRR